MLPPDGRVVVGQRQQQMRHRGAQGEVIDRLADSKLPAWPREGIEYRAKGGLRVMHRVGEAGTDLRQAAHASPRTKVKNSTLELAAKRLVSSRRAA